MFSIKLQIVWVDRRIVENPRYFSSVTWDEP